MFTVKAYLPVMESFGFNGELRQQTSGQAFPQLVFDHWDQMNGSPLEKGSKLEDLVKNIRTRKGLKVSLPCTIRSTAYSLIHVVLSLRFLRSTLTTTSSERHFVLWSFSFFHVASFLLCVMIRRSKLRCCTLCGGTNTLFDHLCYISRGERYYIDVG
jgi:hypothetical protein